MPVAKHPGSADRTVEHARAAPIGRTGHRSGITAALHWHGMPATGALIFLFLEALLHTAVYCGIPKSADAKRAMMKVFEQLDGEKRAPAKAKRRSR